MRRIRIAYVGISEPIWGALCALLKGFQHQCEMRWVRPGLDSPAAVLAARCASVVCYDPAYCKYSQKHRSTFGTRPRPLEVLLCPESTKIEDLEEHLVKLSPNRLRSPEIGRWLWGEAKRHVAALGAWLASGQAGVARNLAGNLLAEMAEASTMMSLFASELNASGDAVARGEVLDDLQQTAARLRTLAGQQPQKQRGLGPSLEIRSLLRDCLATVEDQALLDTYELELAFEPFYGMINQLKPMGYATELSLRLYQSDPWLMEMHWPRFPLGTGLLTVHHEHFWAMGAAPEVLKPESTQSVIRVMVPIAPGPVAEVCTPTPPISALEALSQRL